MAHSQLPRMRNSSPFTPRVWPNNSGKHKSEVFKRNQQALLEQKTNGTSRNTSTKNKETLSSRVAVLTTSEHDQNETRNEVVSSHQKSETRQKRGWVETPQTNDLFTMKGGMIL